MTIEIPDKLLLVSPYAVHLYIHLAVNGGVAESQKQLAAWMGYSPTTQFKKWLLELRQLNLIRVRVVEPTVGYIGRLPLRIEIIPQEIHADQG